MQTGREHNRDKYGKIACHDFDSGIFCTSRPPSIGEKSRSDSDLRINVFHREQGVPWHRERVRGQQRTVHVNRSSPTRAWTYIEGDRIEEMRRAFGNARDRFSTEASQFVDFVRQNITSTRIDPTSKAIYTFYEALESHWAKLEACHDNYGALESQFEDFKRYLDPSDWRGIPYGSTLPETSPARSSLFTDGKGSYGSTQSYTSQGSMADDDTMEVHLLLGYTEKMALSDYYSQLLEDASTDKEDLIALVDTAKSENEKYPFSADLVAQNDRAYHDRQRQKDAIMVEVREIRERMREHNLFTTDNDFDSPIRLVLLQRLNPPRSPLLIPLDDLTHKKPPYDQPEMQFGVESKPNPRTLVLNINTWLLHMLQRSSLHVLLFKNELNALGVQKDERDSPALLNNWFDDEITKMSSDRAYAQISTLDSTPYSTQVSLGDGSGISFEPDTRSVEETVPLLSETSSGPSGQNRDYNAFVERSNAFTVVQHTSTHREAPHMDENEFNKLFGDIEDDDIPIIPVTPSRSDSITQVSRPTSPLADDKTSTIVLERHFGFY